jgi:alginate O-acetyltransferase complex protein AlgI
MSKRTPSTRYLAQQVELLIPFLFPGESMIFNSVAFVVFFATVLFLHSLSFSWKVKKVNLPIASYIFYAAWNPPFVILLWLSTVVDWFAARGLAEAQVP